MTPARLLRLLPPVLEVLAEAHGRGLVHRDLKPSNMFLVEPATEAEHLKLLDFGVAHVRAEPPARDGFAWTRDNQRERRQRVGYL